MLVKSSGVGGSDGFNVGRATLLRLTINETDARVGLLYTLSSVIATVLALLATHLLPLERAACITLACATTNCASSISAPRCAGPWRSTS